MDPLHSVVAFASAHPIPIVDKYRLGDGEGDTVATTPNHSLEMTSEQLSSYWFHNSGLSDLKESSAHHGGPSSQQANVSLMTDEDDSSHHDDTTSFDFKVGQIFIIWRTFLTRKERSFF
jgi:hypothetical protein